MGRSSILLGIILRIIAIIAQWSLALFCVLLIIPVLLGVPGKAEPWELIFYLAIVLSVTHYPVLLAILTIGRVGKTTVDARRYTLMIWTSFGLTALVLTSAAALMYARDLSRPVLTPEERYANIYANAIPTNNVEWLRSILDEGADVNQELSYDGSPLVLAASFGSWPAVVLLLEKGADPDMSGDDGISARTIILGAESSELTAQNAAALARAREMLATE